MNDLIFEGHKIRILDREGEPWWVLSEVCAVLEIENPRNVAARLGEDEKGVQTMDTLGGPQEMLIVSEPGLYKLIQTSRKPTAKRFDRWVRHVVLPEIRKTGSYGRPVGSDMADLAEMLVKGMKEAIAPLGMRLETYDNRFNRLDERLSTLEKRLPKREKIISDATKQQHIDAVKFMGGRCPCCSKNELFISEPLSKHGQFDHFFTNQYPSVDYTWLICIECHDNFTRNRYTRDQYAPEFNAYHNRRRRLPGAQTRLL